MAQLLKPFVAAHWPCIQPCDSLDAATREIKTPDVAWLPVDLIELYRDSYAIMLELERLGIKRTPQYKAALEAIKSQASE